MIELRMLGSLELQGSDGRELMGLLTQSKRVALLAYLCCHHPHGFHRRDTLLGLFWRELDQEHARTALRKALHFLRHGLGENVVISRGDAVGVDPQAFWCDVPAFESALDSGETEKALTLYRGDMLEGFYVPHAPEFERWLGGERERLRGRASHAAWALARAAEEAGNSVEAAHWARRAVAIFPDDEGAVRSLIELLDRAGDRAGALREYEALAERLAEEYEIEPSPETRALIEEIRAREEPRAEARVEAGVAQDGLAPARPERPGASQVAAKTGSHADEAAGRLFTWRDAIGVGLAYLAAAWLVLQVIDVLAEPWHLSEALRRGLQALLALGFFVALAIARYHGKQGRHRVTVPQLLVIALVCAVAAAVLREVGSRSAAGERKKPAIAVLPLRNISPDPGDAYFAEGMHEEIISHLAMISSITVISRNSVMRYRDGATPTPTIATELRVDFVLEGSVRKDSGRVRLTAQLIDARTDEHRWSQEYDRDLSAASLFDIQSDVSRRVAEALQVRISALVRGRIEGHPTESAAAYDLFLRAAQLPYDSDPAANIAAEELLKLAIAFDPGFADAQAHLSSVYLSRAYDLGDSRAWADSGLVLARRAIERDPGLGSGYGALGLNYLELGRLSQASEAFRKILELQPSDGFAVLALGWIEFLRGRLAEAVKLWGDALAIDPLNATILIDMSAVEIPFGNYRRSDRWLRAANALDPGHPYLGVALGLHLRAQGKTSGAVDEAERFLSARPRFFLALEWAAETATWIGDYERARQHFEELQRIAPQDWNYWGLTYRTSYGHVLLKLGELERGKDLLERTLHKAMRLLQEGDERPGIRREIAAIHAARGDREQAYEWLARAIDSGWRLERLLPSPLFESLRGEERFQQLMRQIDADIERMKTRVKQERLGPALP